MMCSPENKDERARLLCRSLVSQESTLHLFVRISIVVTAQALVIIPFPREREIIDTAPPVYTPDIRCMFFFSQPVEVKVIVLGEAAFFGGDRRRYERDLSEKKIGG